MPVRTPKEVFLMLLSEVRNRTERQSNIYQEIGNHAEEPEIREAIEARLDVNARRTSPNSTNASVLSARSRENPVDNCKKSSWRISAKR